jgi:tRNA pseudouridine38-40 synthase
MRYFIELSYNGKNYCGWQKQPNAMTVQEAIELAIATVDSDLKDIELTGCGRTDTGVNASQFFAHFDTEIFLDDNACLALIKKINAFLGKDIVVHKIFKVEDDLHARFSAISRTYKYYVLQNANPFKSEFCYFFNYDLDINKMNDVCAILSKYKDFSAFSKSNTQTFTNDCTIYKAQWKRNGDEIVFTIQANRFLRNMVRAIVGTMLEVGRGRISVQDFCEIIESKDRSRAGQSVPANALFLTEVRY